MKIPEKNGSSGRDTLAESSERGSDEPRNSPTEASIERPLTPNLVKRLRASLERRGIGVWRVTHGPFGRLNFALYRIGFPPFGMSVRRRLLAQLDIDLVLDCGANVGQYALGLRNAGYEGHILSIDPGAEPFEALVRNASGDEKWHCLKAAVYSSDTRITLNVSELSPCNTVLKPIAGAEKNVPGIETADTEEVEAKTIDTIMDEWGEDADRIWLKLDVEGAEIEALAGAERTLPKVLAVEAELGLVRIYEEEPLFYDVSKVLYDSGFYLVNAAGAYQDQGGTWIKIDGIFLREELRGSVKL